MMDLQHQPLYRINTVCELTGLSPDAVRVWERRYGIPQPQRTAGGHRLYSRRDVRTLQWLVARQTEGMRISKAIKLWRELESQGRDPLFAAHAHAQLAGASSSLRTYRETWLQACLDFDEPAAEQALDAAFAEHDSERVCTDVLQRGLHDLGELWYRNQASVQQEHFASELAMRRLHHLLAIASVPLTKQTVVVVMPVGEQHSFPTLLLTLFLRRRGWQAMYLGADVPLEHLARALADTQTGALVLAAQVFFNVANLKATAELAANMGIPVGYGGAIFNVTPSLRQHIPGYFLGQTLLEALENIPLLVDASMPPVKPPAIPAGYAALSQALHHAHVAIDSTVKTQLAQTPMPEGALASSLNFIYKHVHTALLLGNLDLISPQIDWVKGLLAHRQINPQLINRFLCAYRDSITHHLGGQGEDIVRWLNHHIQEEKP